MESTLWKAIHHFSNLFAEHSTNRVLVKLVCHGKFGLMCKRIKDGKCFFCAVAMAAFHLNQTRRFLFFFIVDNSILLGIKVCITG